MVLDVERARDGRPVVCLGFTQGNRRPAFDEVAWVRSHPEEVFDNLASRAKKARVAAGRARKTGFLSAAFHYEIIASQCEREAEEILRLA